MQKKLKFPVELQYQVKNVSKHIKIIYAPYLIFLSNKLLLFIIYASLNYMQFYFFMSAYLWKIKTNNKSINNYQLYQFFKNTHVGAIRNKQKGEYVMVRTKHSLIAIHRTLIAILFRFIFAEE